MIPALRNYDPKRDFFDQYSKELNAHIEMILEYKNSANHLAIPRHVQHGTINLRSSDQHTRFCHNRSMLDLVPHSHLFERRRVIDIGVGFGGMYYPIRFGRPKKIIALDPFVENLELIKDLGYDEFSPVGWEDHKFLPGDFAFIRRTWLTDWRAFSKAMCDQRVTDILIIQDFLDLPLDDVYQHIDVGETVVCRWTYDKPIKILLTPTISEIIKIFREYDYALMHQSSRAKHPFKRIFTLHFTRVKP